MVSGRDLCTANRSDATSIDLTEVLLNMSNELSRLHEVALTIDDIVGEKVSNMKSVSVDERKVLQSIDELRQSIHCLSIFSKSLSTEVAGGGPADAAQLAKGIYLRSLLENLLSDQEVGSCSSQSV